MFRLLIFLISIGARGVRAMFRRRADLVIENLALRQQMAALKKERPRPRLDDVDRAFWVALRDSWPAWASRLVIVKADTVTQRSRDRFRRYWTKISQQNRTPGRPRVDAEIRRLIRLMRAYVSYYHEDRCHLGLDKDTPDPRAVTPRPSPTAKVVALPRVGGHHHRYEWREAA